jgi:hypothetical protein
MVLPIDKGFFMYYLCTLFCTTLYKNWKVKQFESLSLQQNQRLKGSHEKPVHNGQGFSCLIF